MNQSHTVPPEALGRELALAKDLARRAGALIMDIYSTDFAVEFKGADPTNPVTLADREANRLIVDALHDAFPDDAILAEESVDVKSRLTHSRLWCVDPIDGTKEFVARTAEFVVMIGLAIDGEARLGVLFQPPTGAMLWGVLGSGERSLSGMEQNGAEHTLRVSDCSDPRLATAVVSRSHPSKTVAKVTGALGIERQRPIGSVGLKMAALAQGTADVYISASNQTHEWDVCGPEAVLRAAGGQVTDITGQPLRYNKDVAITPRGILATNGLLHHGCVQAIAPLLRERGW